MAMFGADVAALRGLAWSLRHRQHEIEASNRRLTSIIENLPWAGGDRDRFIDEWQRLHNPMLATAATEMAVASRQASVHADHQERASRRA